MYPTPENAIESLEAIIDKYESPELFSFLDYWEIQTGAGASCIKAGIAKNSAVSLAGDEGLEPGIVTDVKDNTCYVNVYGFEREVPLSSPGMAKWDAKSMAFDWAKRLAWGDAQRFILKTLSYYLSIAHKFDKIQSLSNSRTQILGHQIESTHRIVNNISPRFLIADEVGLGKTVEAGLVIKEFMIRNNYSRVLIVTPASLQLQWQQEMSEKLNESFTVVDGRALARFEGRLPEKTIMSLDFAKQERIKTILLKTKWDTIVFDEAHKLRRDSAGATQAYALAEAIGQKARVFLLLSATPFSGKLEELYYLIRLLNPSLLGSIHRFELDYDSGKKQDIKNRLSSVIIRRRKSDVGGFTRRFAKTITIELTEEEQALYERTTEYIRKEYNKALETKNNMHAFILTVYQKMLDSSSHAIIHTIASRILYLEKILIEDAGDSLDEKRLKGLAAAAKSRDFDPERSERFSRCGYSKEAAFEMKKELQSLREIHRLALRIRINKKGEILKRIIAKIISEDKNAKVLIFTQFARTQEYLFGLLRDYKVSRFNGSMDKTAKDRAILEFRHNTNVLVSTEAGGEGRNLQFCHYLINYDLPWNPQKIEQRIGRLHRFGQNKDVRIYNFSTKDTIGARVLDVLENKIKVFEDSIGATDTLLGYYEEEIDFNATFMKFHTDPEKVGEELDGKITKMKGSFEHLEELMSHKVIDFNLDAFYDSTRTERAASNKLIKKMMEDYALLDDSGLSITKTDSAQNLYTITEKSSGKGFSGYFESRDALAHPERDFFAFGHPLVDKAAERMRELSFLGLTARIRIKRGGVRPGFEGMLFNFILSIRGANIMSELVPVFTDRAMNIQDEESSQIESEFLAFDMEEQAKSDPCTLTSDEISAVYKRALLRLEFKIKDKVQSRKKEITSQIELAIPLINAHYESILSELGELLEIQKSKEKIYNITTMKSIISRTENKIKQFKAQAEAEIERIKNIKSLHVSYYLLNVAHVLVE